MFLKLLLKVILNFFFLIIFFMDLEILILLGIIINLGFGYY